MLRKYTTTNMCKSIMEVDQLKKEGVAVANAGLFLTPPSSNECPLPHKCLSRITTRRRSKSDSEKLTFDLDLGDDEIIYPCELSCKVDLLKECYLRSLVGTVCSKIFSKLSEEDLLR